ncbi:MAG TPA: ParA family protein [Ktedonobacterales bacterium]|jgi:chromosome partitioning protein|nr:ParA family protein [Ktedonobacterales bacterium]
MPKVYGVAIRKGGQGKSTTVSTVARLCALYGARTLVIDLAQPGTTTASLRDIWPATAHGDLSTVLLTLHEFPAGSSPDGEVARAALEQSTLPVRLISQPSWSGGALWVLPWDDLLGEAAAFLESERVLSGVIEALASEIDIALIDFPSEGGPLMTTALAATDSIIMPMAPEAPALEGAAATLRLLARVRESGRPIELGGLLITRVEPRSKRLVEVVQAIKQAGEIEGESLERKLFPFAIRHHEYFEQAFRYGVPVWERTDNMRDWAGYVMLAEWLLRDAGLTTLTTHRRGPALLAPETRLIDTTAVLLSDNEVMLRDFEHAHPAS